MDTRAPVFEGPDVESGEPLSSEQYKGKVIVVNFWASWCQECKVEHENLLRLYDEFKDHPEFVMVGINYQDERPKARAYLQRYGSSFPHMQDVKGALAIDFGVYGVPETFVIDKQGIIRHKWIGPIVDNVYTNLTKNVLTPLLQKADTRSLRSGQALGPPLRPDPSTGLPSARLRTGRAGNLNVSSSPYSDRSVFRFRRRRRGKSRG